MEEGAGFGAVLDKKKASYSSTPTFLESLVQESIKPLAEEEWKKYVESIQPDLRKLIQTKLSRKVDKAKLLEAVNIALDKAFAHVLKIEFTTNRY